MHTNALRTKKLEKEWVSVHRQLINGVMKLELFQTKELSSRGPESMQTDTFARPACSGTRAATPLAAIISATRISSEDANRKNVMCTKKVCRQMREEYIEGNKGDNKHEEYTGRFK